MAYEFRFPDIGEGVTEGELLSWKVKEGDIVAEDQTLAELETDKAVVELPSPRAGRVSKLHAAEGDIIQVGDVVVTIEETAAGPTAPAAAVAPAPAPVAASAQAPPAQAAAAAAAPAPAPVATEPEPYTGSVVGRLEEAPEEEEGVAAAAAPTTPLPPTVLAPPPPRAAPAPAAAPSPAAPSAAVPPSATTAPGAEVLAMPSVRALAQEVGVDITAIRGTGPGGRILKQDVEDVAEATAYGAVIAGTPRAPRIPPLPVAEAPSVFAAPGPAPGAVPGAAPAAPEAAAAATEVEPVGAPPAAEAPLFGPIMGGVIEQDAFGPVERVAFRGVRRTMARRMAESVAKQAQVTTMDDADVTIIKRIREKERTVAAERGVRLTYLAFVVKACTASLKRFPRLNAVLSESGDEFLLKRYYNIGIAVDTKYGLVVPNIKDADKKSIFRIAEEIVDLVDRADERRLDLSELHGGTFTISNYGAIGTTFATPVINYPEVALLGMGRVRELPVVREGKVVTRLMLPLSLTIDHQLIDGAEAARFLNLVMGYLEDPDLLLLEGA
jgi:pyruvate/2-oxoglutarate dehydrogenase complex dihydrolipoamide acyltransferase (E2) component